MRIRCKNCYRVLNNNEEWCTRCGAHSDEVAELIAKGIEPLDEMSVAKTNSLLYLLIAFLINGILSVLFGVIFDSMYEGYNYGSVGTDLPLAIKYFSAINALTISGLVMMVVAFFINLKEIKKYFIIKKPLNFWISLAAGLLILIGLCFASKYSYFSIIPFYFKEFLTNPTEDMLLSGSMNILKVLVVLLSYGIVEEFVFRKAFMSALDECTLMPDWAIVVVDALVGTVLFSVCFLILVKTTALNYLLGILASIVFNALMATNYFINDHTITSNLILRVLLVILVFVIL